MVSDSHYSKMDEYVIRKPFGLRVGMVKSILLTNVHTLTFPSKPKTLDSTQTTLYINNILTSKM